MSWNFLRQFSVRLPCSTRDALLTSRWTWFLACSPLAYPDKERNLARRELLRRAFWHFSLTGPLVSQTICSSDLKRRTRSAESCLLHSLCKAFQQRCPSSWVNVELMITQLIHGHDITQNVTWLQYLWKILIPYLFNTFGLCHHLRQQKNAGSKTNA